MVERMIEGARETISPEELKSRQALIFLDTLNLLEKTPREFLKINIIAWQNLKISEQEGKKDVFRRLSHDLYDLSFKSDQPEVSQRFIHVYGEGKTILHDMLDLAKPRLKKIQEKRMNPFESYGIVQRIKIAGTLTSKILLRKTLDQEQKERFLNLIGYSKEETASTLLNIGKSLALSIPGLVIYGAAAGTAGSYALKNPLFSEVDNNARIALSLAILTNQLTTLLSTNSDKRLLDATGISPNSLATGMYYVLKKLLPDYKKSITPGILTVSSLPAIIQDISAGGGSLISSQILSATVAADLALSSLHLTETAIKEWVIFLKNRKIKSKT